MHPRFTIHASPAASSTTISSAVRPDGNASVVVRSHEGALRRCALLIERLTFGAVDISLEDKRTVADFPQARPARPIDSSEPNPVRELGLFRKNKVCRDY